MEKYMCNVCGYVYDPAENDGIAFVDLPDDWECPVCGVGKDEFSPCQDLVLARLVMHRALSTLLSSQGLFFCYKAEQEIF